MDDKKFPDSVGELGGLSFSYIFENKPKIVEFLRRLWIEAQCTGIYLDFYKYTMGMLNCPFLLQEHEERCKKFVKGLDDDKVPDYMKSYL